MEYNYVDVCVYKFAVCIYVKFTIYLISFCFINGIGCKSAIQFIFSFLTMTIGCLYRNLSKWIMDGIILFGTNGS